MKLVKTTTEMDITSSFDGNLYHITPTGIEVSDEVAEKMKEQFLHTVEVTDISTPSDENISSDEIDDADAEIKE